MFLGPASLQACEYLRNKIQTYDNGLPHILKTLLIDLKHVKKTAQFVTELIIYLANNGGVDATIQSMQQACSHLIYYLYQTMPHTFHTKPRTHGESRSLVLVENRIPLRTKSPRAYAPPVAKADIIWRWAPRRLNKAHSLGQVTQVEKLARTPSAHRRVKREANELL